MQSGNVNFQGQSTPTTLQLFGPVTANCDVQITAGDGGVVFLSYENFTAPPSTAPPGYQLPSSVFAVYPPNTGAFEFTVNVGDSLYAYSSNQYVYWMTTQRMR